MMSKTRRDSNQFVIECFEEIGNSHIKKNILYCGVAGNPKLEGFGPIPDNYALYENHNLITVDIDSFWGPNICADISDKNTFDKSFENFFDIIVLTQTIEHVRNIGGVKECLLHLLKTGGYAIVDCPWGPESPDYHAEPPSFGDYWRISDEGLILIFCGNLNEFSPILKQRTSANSALLLLKQ